MTFYSTTMTDPNFIYNCVCPWQCACLCLPYNICITIYGQLFMFVGVIVCEYTYTFVTIDVLAYTYTCTYFLYYHANVYHYLRVSEYNFWVNSRKLSRSGLAVTWTLNEQQCSLWSIGIWIPLLFFESCSLTSVNSYHYLSAAMLFQYL